MQAEWSRKPAAEVLADALIIPAFEDRQPRLDLPVDQAIAGFYDSGEFSGKKFTSVVLHDPAGLRAKRLLLAGCGKREEFTSGRLRRIAGMAVRKLKSKAVRRAALLLDGEHRTPERAGAAIEGAITGDWEPDRYKTDENEKQERLAGFTVVTPAGDEVIAAAIERARILAEAQNFARDLAGEPANHLSPSRLAARARQLAAEQQLACEVLDRAQMQQLGMGALLGVARGSTEPPALIIVRYRPETDRKSTRLNSSHIPLSRMPSSA